MYTLFVILLFGSGLSLDLPSYFPKCCANDPLVNNCIVEAAKKLKPFIKNGIKELGIETLYPIRIPYYKLNYGESNTNFVTTATNLTLYGMDDYHFENFEFNPKEISMKGKLVYKALFNYCFYVLRNGTLMDIPVSGEGIFGGLLGPLNITFSIRASLENRNGLEYAKISNMATTTDIESFPIAFQGLDTENGAWGNANDVFRNNGKLIGKHVGAAYNSVFRSFSLKYLDWFLSEIPYNQLFPC